MVGTLLAVGIGLFAYKALNKNQEGGGAGSVEDFAAWKSAHAGWDAHSLDADAQLADASEFTQPAAQRPVYDWAKATPQGSSPVFGAGTSLQQVTTDFTGAARASGSKDLGALAKH